MKRSTACLNLSALGSEEEVSLCPEPRSRAVKASSSSSRVDPKGFFHSSLKRSKLVHLDWSKWINALPSTSRNPFHTVKLSQAESLLKEPVAGVQVSLCFSCHTMVASSSSLTEFHMTSPRCDRCQTVEDLGLPIESVASELERQRLERSEEPWRVDGPHFDIVPVAGTPPATSLLSIAALELSLSPERKPLKTRRSDDFSPTFALGSAEDVGHKRHRATGRFLHEVSRDSLTRSLTSKTDEAMPSKESSKLRFGRRYRGAQISPIGWSVFTKSCTLND